MDKKSQQKGVLGPACLFDLHVRIGTDGIFTVRAAVRDQQQIELIVPDGILIFSDRLIVAGRNTIYPNQIQHALLGLVGHLFYQGTVGLYKYLAGILVKSPENRGGRFQIHGTGPDRMSQLGLGQPAS